MNERLKDLEADFDEYAVDFGLDVDDVKWLISEVKHNSWSLRIEAKLDELLAKKKRVVKPKGSKPLYPEDFISLWNAYPKRAGSNPKNRAYSAALARCKEQDNVWNKMFCGVERYAGFCDATGKTGTEYVMQAATFFGPDKHYENDWTIPASAKRETLPRNDEDLEAFAVGHKLHSWGNAPEHVRNMRQYREWIKERM